MPKRPTPIDSLRLDDASREAVRGEYDLFLNALEQERRQFGWRRFTEIDLKLGRRPGFVAKILALEESLTVDRLFALLKVLNRSFKDFVLRLFKLERIPSAPPPGFIGAAVETGAALKRHGRLVDWLQRVEIAPAPVGSKFQLDASLLIKESESDPKAALSTVKSHLDFLRKIQPEALTAETANSLCWLLAAIAYVYRSVDRLEEAAVLLDQAFGLEARIDNTDTRGLLFRESAYLLSQLGFIDEAEQCACKAIDLAHASPRGKGLGESLYARASMVRWQGEPVEALVLLGGTLPHLPEASSLRFAAVLASAWLYIDLGQPEQALTQLRKIETEARKSPPLSFAKFRLANAVVQWMLGDTERADEHFAAAERLLDKHGPTTDQAIALLWKCRYWLAARRRVASLANQLTRLAGRMRRGSSAEAAVFAVATAILADEIDAAAVLESIATLQRPWARRLRTAEAR